MAKQRLGERSPGPSPPPLSSEPTQLGGLTRQQLPHVSCETFKGDFPKRKSSPTHTLPHVPKLKSFHGDSQIANPSKNELVGGIKLPIPRETGLAGSKLPIRC